MQALLKYMARRGSSVLHSWPRMMPCASPLRFDSAISGGAARGGDARSAGAVNCGRGSLPTRCQQHEVVTIMPEITYVMTLISRAVALRLDFASESTQRELRGLPPPPPQHPLAVLSSTFIARRSLMHTHSP